MADDPQEFPGFVEDKPKRKVSRTPEDAQTARQDGGKPIGGFDPFAGSAGAPGMVGDAEADEVPAGTAQDAEARAEAESEVSPGSRKDLWACPHCSARNRPERTTCRDCGKSPSDDVEPPWHADPTVRKAMMGAGGVVVLFILLWLFWPQPGFQAPGPAHVDSRLRDAGSSSLSFDMGKGRTFDGSRLCYLSGRVLDDQLYPGQTDITQVAEVVGSDAKDDAGFAKASVDFTATPPQINGAAFNDPVVVDLIFKDVPKPVLTKGTWLSIAGIRGHIIVGGQDQSGSDIVIDVTKVETQAP